MGVQPSKEPFIVVYKKTAKQVQKEVPATAATHPPKSEDFQDAAKELAKGTCQHCQASPDASKIVEVIKSKSSVLGAGGGKRI